MKISAAGLQFIKNHEGLRLTAYPDPATGGKPWTIGVGRAHGVNPGDTCTEAEAMEWLREDCATAEQCIEDHVDVDLTQNQHDSLVSFIFNVGCGNFKASTMLRLMNSGQLDAAAQQFQRWAKANGKEMAGLVTRRRDEAILFQT